jgi:hypothetical protein
LRPLILELKELWNNGVKTRDAGTKKNFRLRVILLWTIKESLHVHTATNILSICG